MLRASAVAERTGVPTASLVCEGFLGQAATTSTGLGLPGLPTALVPGHVYTAEVHGTIFEALRDPAMFEQVRVELGAVAWPNGADLAPDAMYDAIRARGYWVVGE